MGIREGAKGSMELPENISPLRSPWVIGWLVLIIIVLAVNILMIVIANLTSSGLVAEDNYERGRNFDESQKARAVEQSLGWKAEINGQKINIAGRPVRYEVVATDKYGYPLEAEEVWLHAFRPSDSGADFSKLMKREKGGRYIEYVTFPLPGTWDVIVRIKKGGQSFGKAMRLFVSDNKARLSSL